MARPAGGAGRAQEQPSSHEYSRTVRVPKCGLLLKPGKASEERYREAVTTGAYRAQWEGGEAGEAGWVTHDGPPYANGPVHMGHLLNKVSKDICNRHRVLSGQRVHYVPGWDCHGLPIELKSQEGRTREEVAATPAPQLRRWARRVAEKAIAGQQASFERWGVMADWASPQGTYRTMDPAYEASQLRVFWRMYENGLVYRGVKPIYWSPSTRTALAEAELEYRDRTSPAVFVRFPLQGSAELLGVDCDALIWTTTPWTLLANRAVCVNGSLLYSIIQNGVFRNDSAVLAAGIPGSSLLPLAARHPLLDLTVPILDGAHVTVESGSGLVHTAPGHGHDDWEVCTRHKVPVFDSVDDEGRFREEIGAPYAGLDVYSEMHEGSAAVLKSLAAADAIFHGPYSYAHRYPYDWRTGQPVIIRTTAQWFASLDEGVRALALSAISETTSPAVQMLPDGGRSRLKAMLTNRYDWCISRQRLWGVPIPVFYHPQTLMPIVDVALIDHLAALFAQHGSDCWYWMDHQQLIPPQWHGSALLAGASPDALIKCLDTMDVWFDSGTSWAHVLAPVGGRADLVIEGSDQHRGWFQSLLLTYVGHHMTPTAPYRTVLTHGFVLDEKGRKMSKSLGNVMDPENVSRELSVEGTRLWVASNKLANADVLASKESLDKALQLLKRIRNSLKFVLGSIGQPSPSPGALPLHLEQHHQPDSFSALDRFFLHQLAVLSQRARQSYEDFNVAQVVQLVSQFIPNVASPIYFEAVKDRLYCDSLDSLRRNRCLYVLSQYLITMLRILAPILPFTAEEVHREHYPLGPAGHSSLQSLRWPDQHPWLHQQLGDEWDRILDLRAQVNKIFEGLNSVRSVRTAISFESSISSAGGSVLRSHLHKVGASELSDLLGCAEVHLWGGPCSAPILHQSSYTPSELAATESISITVRDLTATHHKCPRCWRWTPNPICHRCSDVLGEAAVKIAQ